MLKWAVYGKKTQDARVPSKSAPEKCDSCTQEPLNNKIRRSLDGQEVKKSKKPNRYQRRSLGANAKKHNVKTIDKENVNYIGNTPNYFKEGFVKKVEGIVLKDVSNITPNSPNTVQHFDRRRFAITDDVPPDLPSTPPTYSRRVREAKKRKLEMSTSSDGFTRNNSVYKSERRINIDRNSLSPRLGHSVSEPSLTDLSDRLGATYQRNSFTFIKPSSYSICTTTANNQGIVEIEYDKDLVLNCIEKPISINKVVDKTTLPIFGNNIFMNNPLYFNKDDNVTNIRPLKRTRKKSNEFESSFKSPTMDKKDAHTLLREGCSPMNITPLSVKLAALRFSTMSTHSKSKRQPLMNDVTEYFPKVEIPFTIPLKDEESCTEMENKFIFCKESLASVTESTVSTSQMGDVTLERMIEDIIKSTKIVKSKRRILNNLPDKQTDDEIPSLESVKDLFVNPQTENKANLIKEAKYINLSRENSVSPKSTPTKKIPVKKVNDKLLKNLPIGCFFLDDGDGYNEREVRTPEVVNNPKISSRNKSRILNRSRSMSACLEKENLETTSSESTPDLYSAAQERASLRLKRQRCIRRKKSTVSNDNEWKNKHEDAKSILTLEIGLPSPAVELPNVSLCEPINSPPCYPLEGCDVFPQNTINSIRSNVSHSSLMPHEQLLSKRCRELFGLTLENGIPSPITPVPNLKRPGKVLSEERAYKTSKIDEDLLPAESCTPVIEHKSIRRCLTYSPEEYSISSSEEKRRSVASNRLERSCERFQAPRSTIDLEITTRNDVIDVHVIRCRDLQKPSGKSDEINAYAKVVISGLPESQSLPSQRSIFQRTSVLYGKREPEFQRHLRLPLPTVIYDHQTLHISVWHRDKKYRRSEFLGCVSFPLKDAIKCDTRATYFLQQGTRAQAAAPAHPQDRCAKERVTEQRKMATDNIETNTNDSGRDCHNDKGATNGPSSTTASQAQAVAAALQREADEHLFLRYLELDPPDDPTAPRRAQRNGRTPFTTTRKLVRGTTGGFGFTVVWTRPPRVERVAQGGSAERSGLRAGDYIVFVGTKNVVTASEEEVRNLVKSAGQMLALETFRRVPPNGLGVRPRLAQVSIPPPESTPPPPPRSPRVAALASPATAARPPTACSSTSQSLDRRKLHLPQVTFSKEVGNGIIV